MPIESSQVPPSPVVSIIIPCYKQAHYLAQTINSALAQDHRLIEVIVINDGSPDDTDKVALAFGDKIIYVPQKNSGLPGARNAGLRRATGDYVIFLDSDDQLLPGTISRHLDALKASHADVAVCPYRELTPAGVVGQFHDVPELRGDVFHQLLGGNIMPPVCFIIRRAILEKVGAFAEVRNFHGLEDWELWLRIAAGGGTFCRASAEVLYRADPASMSGNHERMFNCMLNVLREFKGYHPDCAECRKGRRAGQLMARVSYLVKIKNQLKYPVRRGRATTVLKVMLEMIRHPKLLWTAWTLAWNNIAGKEKK